MKTISLDDEAYEMLRGAKITAADSFSDVVKRLIRPKRSIMDSAGGWADMTDEEAANLRRETREAFERPDWGERRPARGRQ